MKRLLSLSVAVSLVAIHATFLAAQEATPPKPIPKNRVDIKKNLEALKTKEPRLPFDSKEDPSGRPSVNNAKARAYFLPAEWFEGERQLGGSTRTEELVDYELKTKCFWIVSRANNCHYCLGHQEHKLAMVGLTDDQLAALDHDWSVFDDRTQRALALALKMTREPHLVEKSDIEALRPAFTDPEIIELVYTIARFNSTNRWTDAIGIPQDSEMRGEEIHFLSDTNPKWSTQTPLATPKQEAKRTLLTDQQMEQLVSKSATTQPFVQLPSVDQTREKLQLDSAQPINDWHRANAALIAGNVRAAANLRTMIQHEELSPTLKIELMKRTANWNRCALTYVMANEALTNLSDGQKQNKVTAEAQQAALDFADKLTVQNFAISDHDVLLLRTHFTDRQIAQIIHVVATSNGLDRFCGTLGLRSNTTAP